MNLRNLKQDAVQAMGFDRLNVMQETLADVAITGKDILLLSPTGTGKTVAFLLPLIWFAQNGNDTGFRQALVLVPSRELAQQIADVFQRLRTGLRAVCCYGGHDYRIEQQALASRPAPALIIGTVGRIKDHIEHGRIMTDSITHLVLDEYDKSLELGFEEDMKAIVGSLPALRQHIMTSATHAMPVAKYLGIQRFEMIDFLPKSPQSENERSCATGNRNSSATASPCQERTVAIGKLEIRQVKSPIADKLDTLLRLLCALPQEAQAIVFSNYRESSERISHFLSDQGVANALYHGGLTQDLRDKALIRFRGGSIRVMVSTDLASRGLDIPEVDHIIHYHLPSTEEVFIHRNGRTARAGADGTAYLIVGPDEYLPAFLNREPQFFNLPAHSRPFIAPQWETVYIGRGKREKISKGDILGFFTKNGNIDGNSIGRIDIQDHCAYVAIRKEVVGPVLAKVQGLKIKGEKTHYLIVRGC